MLGPLLYRAECILEHIIATQWHLPHCKGSVPRISFFFQEGRCKATWKSEVKGEFKIPWRETSPLNHQDDEADSDQLVVKKELSIQPAAAGNAEADAPPVSAARFPASYIIPHRWQVRLTPLQGYLAHKKHPPP